MLISLRFPYKAYMYVLYTDGL